MSEEKSAWVEVEREAKILNFGILTIEAKIQDGKIVFIEITKERKQIRIA